MASDCVTLRAYLADMSLVCLACRSWAGEPVCRACAATLSGGADTRLPTGLLVRSAYRHDGAARELVHRLKYQGLGHAAVPLAAAMAVRVPAGARCLVPVPRAGLRRWRHGVDPARELARALGALTGLPVTAALRAPLWWPAHAGRGRAGRSAPQFRRSADVTGSVLVDDVLTTGMTLAAAGAALGGAAMGAVTATAALRTALSRDPRGGYSAP